MSERNDFGAFMAGLLVGGVYYLLQPKEQGSILLEKTTKPLRKEEGTAAGEAEA